MSKAPNQVGTNTTTTSTTPPSYVTAAQQGLLGTAANLTAPFTGSAPNYMVAGFNPDQEMGFDLARYQAQAAYGTPQGGTVSQYGSYTAAPSPTTAASISPAAQAQAYLANASLINPSSVNQMDAARSQAEQLTANGDIRPLFNPYQQDVVGTTTQQLEEANARQLAAIRARQAAESAYGGNRGALQENEQNRNFGNTLANTVAGLNYGGWNTAANLGMQNVGFRQQTGLANQQAQQQANMANMSALNQALFANQQYQNQVNLANAGFQNTNSMFNTGQSNQVGMYNTGATNSFAQLQAQMQQQANLANQSNSQAVNLFNAQQPLNVASMNNNLYNADWQRQMQALQQLLGTGGTQQQLAQTAINAPWTGLNYLQSTVPSQYGSSGTSSQPIYGANTFQSILPLASLAGGLLSSDKTMKTDIQKMGKDPRTGLDMHAYRYKGDPKNTPKVVGPMAQDVEKKYPGSTVRVGGKLAITAPARTMLGI